MAVTFRVGGDGREQDEGADFLMDNEGSLGDLPSIVRALIKLAVAVVNENGKHN